MRFLCFREFKIPLVHLSFYCCEGDWKDWKSVGNPLRRRYGRESLVTSRTLYLSLDWFSAIPTL